MARAAGKKKASKASRSGAKPSRRKPRATTARRATKSGNRARARAGAKAVARRKPARAKAGARRTTATSTRTTAAKKPGAVARGTSSRAKSVGARASSRVAGSRSAAPRATASRRTPRSAAPRATASRSTSRTATPRPARVVTRPVAVPPVPPAFSAQRAGADARAELLFELQRSRASVKAAIQGLAGGNAERPIAPGKWSIKEIVLHLSERDRVRLEEFGRTLGGQPRSWADISHEEQDAVNEVHLAPLRAHTWDEAVRRLDSLREQLLWRLSQLPAQPDDVWQRGHAFGDMMWGLPEHDRKHADQIKLARIGDLVPVED